MSMLASLERPKDRAAMVTIAGEAGVGKTTLAALLPDPVVVRVEDGLQSIPERYRPRAFPLALTFGEVMDQVRDVVESEHPFPIKTLVIDSISKLNKMIETEIVDADPKASSINTALGGYGAGARGVAETHSRLKKLCDRAVFERGINVVFISHVQVESVTLPDKDAYDKYTLRMDKHSRQMYLDDVDLVGFIKLESVVGKHDANDKKAKASSTGNMIVTCYSVANHDSKNRYGICDDLPYKLGVNPFQGIVNALSNPAAEQAA